MTTYSEEFSHLIEDANYMLEYAVEAGIQVESDVANKIMTVDKQGNSYSGSVQLGDIFASITRLASLIHPVTPETLRACREEARHAIHIYEVIVIILAAILLPTSILSAVYNGITSAINAELAEGNEAALKLHAGAISAIDLSNLQQLAINARSILNRAKQLNKFNIIDGDLPKDLPKNDDLEIKLKPSPSESDIEGEIARFTDMYQVIRRYSKDVMANTSIWFGAITTTILPILYSLLGACASVLRVFGQQLERRTFNYSYASPARFIIAAIGGGVIGLFNFTVGQGVTVPPLALAFLVGYSTDVFFSFLEGSLPNAKKNEHPEPTRTASPK